MNRDTAQARQFINLDRGAILPDTPAIWIWLVGVLHYLGWLFTQKQDSGSDSKRTVRAGRRRPSEPSSPQERPRAEAPQRRKPGADTGGGIPPSGSTSTGGLPFPLPSGGGSGRRMGGLGLGAVILLLICFVVFRMLTGSPDESDLGSDFEPVEPAATQAGLRPTSTRPAPTATRAAAQPAVAPGDQTWLVMLYQDADDKVLEQDIYFDLNEVERVGSSPRVQIVAQVDRYRGGYQGDGNWNTTRRFYVTQDDDLNRVSSQEIASPGEVNMSDGDTLVDFVTWAIENYPADKHVLILSDHGMGWPGGWSDPDPGGSGERSLPLSSVLGDQLYLMELDQALGEIRTQTGLEKFEMIGMDACLMSHIEVYSALVEHARYAVASQETEPSLGWAYTSFLGELQANPDIDGAELGRLILESYIQEDQRIVDDQARAEFLRQGSPMGGLFGMLGGVDARQVARQIQDGITLSVVDMSAIPELVNSLNELTVSLSQVDQRQVARARSYAQSFTSIFGREVPASYIDLGNFVQLLYQQIGGTRLQNSSERLLQALDQAVIAERHGPKKPGATGISIYFPNSQLYQSPVAGPQSYTVVARRFAEQSLWDDFLAFHYTGRPFEATAGEVAVPGAGTAVRGPGTGELRVSPLSLSSTVAAPGQPILLSADILADNLGHILLFAGYYDPAANSIFIADMDYLESPDTREVDGVYYPDWGEGEFTLEFEWEPLVFAISDGVDLVPALFKPQDYGATPEEAIYSVDGIYTFADDGETRYARLYFADGVMRQVFGFTGEDFAGAPREIIPQAGDTFTLLESWLDLDQSGQAVESVTQEGATLTFGEQAFTWQELSAAPGDYVVGLIVQDLDGNSREVYAQATVR